MYLNLRSTLSVDDMDEHEVQRELSTRIIKWMRSTQEYKPKELKRLRTLCKRRKVTAEAVVIAVGREKALLVFNAMPNLFGANDHDELTALLRGL